MSRQTDDIGKKHPKILMEHTIVIIVNQLRAKTIKENNYSKKIYIHFVKCFNDVAESDCLIQ